MSRSSRTRLLVMLPVLIVCAVVFRHVRITHGTGRAAGDVPARAKAAATVQVNATGTAVLVPVPAGFVALDPYRPDHSRLWFELSATLPGTRVLSMLVPEECVAADGSVSADVRPDRLAFVGVPHALDDMPFDGGDFRVVRTRLRGPLDWTDAEDPAGTGPQAERVPLVRMAELIPDQSSVRRVAADDPHEYRALIDLHPAGHAAVGLVHTGSRIVSVATVAVGGEAAADWCRDTGRWLHAYIRAAPAARRTKPIRPRPAARRAAEAVLTRRPEAPSRLGGRARFVRSRRSTRSN